jgi:hypothetical protein
VKIQTRFRWRALWGDTGDEWPRIARRQQKLGLVSEPTQQCESAPYRPRLNSTHPPDNSGFPRTQPVTCPGPCPAPAPSYKCASAENLRVSPEAQRLERQSHRDPTCLKFPDSGEIESYGARSERSVSKTSRVILPPFRLFHHRKIMTHWLIQSNDHHCKVTRNFREHAFSE